MQLINVNYVKLMLHKLRRLLYTLLSLVHFLFLNRHVLLQVVDRVDCALNEVLAGTDLLGKLNKFPALRRQVLTDVQSEDYPGSASPAHSVPDASHVRKRGRDAVPVNTTSSVAAPFLRRRFFEQLKILCIDIGATRTKFMYKCGSENLLLPPLDSASLWQTSAATQPGLLSPRGDENLRIRLGSHLMRCPQIPVSLHELDYVIFSVPGTVDFLQDPDDTVVVKNMPQFSPLFRGFNFKLTFQPLFPNAKIQAVADNLAAALGVANFLSTCQSALVIVLGSAPAVATFFRAAPKSKSIECAIWQSWAWFTKIPLADPYGYCGGLKIGKDGKSFELRDKKTHKIPHKKARIRLAIDASTWKRLQGKLEDFPQELQGNLSEADATRVWGARVQAAVDALALRFHQVYGKPEKVVLLGGNGIRCRQIVEIAKYKDPDVNRQIQVPVFIPADDQEQQIVHMGGLSLVAAYKRAHVYAPGPDPLARGWTRGGEIYLWVRRNDII